MMIVNEVRWGSLSLHSAGELRKTTNHLRQEIRSRSREYCRRFPE